MLLRLIGTFVSAQISFKEADPELHIYVRKSHIVSQSHGKQCRAPNRVASCHSEDKELSIFCTQFYQQFLLSLACFQVFIITNSTMNHEVMIKIEYLFRAAYPVIKAKQLHVAENSQAVIY